MGRPLIPPCYMLPLTLMQPRQGWSDREAVEEAYFDDRGKFTLGLGHMPQITCDRATLCAYRGALHFCGAGSCNA